MFSSVSQLIFSVRSNFYIVAVSVYVIILFINYVRFGTLFQFSVGLYSLAALPIALVILHNRGKSDELLRTWIPFVVILLSYEALAGIVGSMVSSDDIVSIYTYDKLLWGFNLTGYVQNYFLSPLLTNLTLFLYSLHFPLIIITSLGLWFGRRSLFNRYAISMAITSYVALLFFVLMPSAPPWYQGVATNLVASSYTASSQATPAFLSWYLHLTSLIESDKFAAFPSLHTAYMILFCYFVTKFKPKLAIITFPLTFGVLFSTLYLGQHYLIDLIAGASLALASVVLAEMILKKYPNLFAVKPKKVSLN